MYKEYNFETVYTPIKDVQPGNTVNFHGVIIKMYDKEIIMKDGTVKDVAVMSIQDKPGLIKVTYWEQLEKIRAIFLDDINVCINLINCSVNTYGGGITLNLNSSTNIILDADIRDIVIPSENDISLNMSQRSETRSEPTIPVPILNIAVKRDLEETSRKRRISENKRN